MKNKSKSSENFQQSFSYKKSFCKIKNGQCGPESIICCAIGVAIFNLSVRILVTLIKSGAFDDWDFFDFWIFLLTNLYSFFVVEYLKES